MKYPIRKLFLNARHWTKGAWARYHYVPIATGCATGRYTVDSTSGAAVCFCLDGAVQKCYTERARIPVRARLRQAIRKLFPNGELDIIGFNDSKETTFSDIMKVVRAAKV